MIELFFKIKELHIWGCLVYEVCNSQNVLLKIIPNIWGIIYRPTVNHVKYFYVIYTDLKKYLYILHQMFEISFRAIWCIVGELIVECAKSFKHRFVSAVCN